MINYKCVMGIIVIASHSAALKRRGVVAVTFNYLTRTSIRAPENIINY